MPILQLVDTGAAKFCIYKIYHQEHRQQLGSLCHPVERLVGSGDSKIYLVLKLTATPHIEVSHSFPVTGVQQVPRAGYLSPGEHHHLLRQECNAHPHTSTSCAAHCTDRNKRRRKKKKSSTPQQQQKSKEDNPQPLTPTAETPPPPKHPRPHYLHTR